MSFTTRIGLSILVLFFTQSMCIFGQTTNNTPWSSPQIMEGFMGAFMSKVANRGFFSGDQLGDMGDIIDQLSGSQGRRPRSIKSSGSVLQAQENALASSLAKVVLAVEGGSGLKDRMQAIESDMQTALMNTTRTVIAELVNNIMRRVDRIVRENAPDGGSP